MKKLLKICVLLLVLLALLLLYGCEQDENSGQSTLDQASNESDSKEENSSLDDSTPEEIAARFENMIFSESGKFGVRAEDGTVFAPAEYDSAEYGWRGAGGFFVLTSGEDYYILQMDGEFVGTEPFDGVDTAWADDHANLLFLTADGTQYIYLAGESGGSINLIDAKSPYLDPKPRNGWFFLRSFSDATRTNYGIVAPSGEVVIEPVYVYAKIPFPDRFVLCEGESMLSRECFLSNLTDSTGKLLNNSFTDLEYVVFDDGKYFGVAYCAGEIADITAYTNGQPTPRGFWFIDKDGNTLSERFDGIEGDFDYGRPMEKNSIVTVTLGDDVHEYTAEKILEKYYK